MKNTLEIPFVEFEFLRMLGMLKNSPRIGPGRKTIYTVHKRVGTSKYSPNSPEEKAKNLAAIRAMGLSTNVYDECWKLVK